MEGPFSQPQRVSLPQGNIDGLTFGMNTNKNRLIVSPSSVIVSRPHVRHNFLRLVVSQYSYSTVQQGPFAVLRFYLQHIVVAPVVFC